MAVIALAAQTEANGLAMIRDEIAREQYGAPTGRLLLAFVTTVGPGKVFDALKAAAAGDELAMSGEESLRREHGMTLRQLLLLRRQR